MVETMREGWTELEGWTDPEQSVAKEAFERAYGRAVERLVTALRDRAAALHSAESVWQLHDYLSIERHTMEGRFDFRLDGILFVFASLVKDDLLTIDELAGLDAEKLAKIAAMSRF
ncbi:hypothetical protein [Vulcanococcus limneticus]|uniref:hypothetical protein n=1 Tax=Vulcanococcus limneticus TaxID=2170428 RepID=UPI00398BDA82